VVANGSGAWSFDYTGTTLAQGNYTFTATATDTAGNVSPVSGTFAVTVDTAAPSAPVVSGVIADSGSSSSDGITNDSTLIIQGTAEANSSVAVKLNASTIGTVTTNGSGNWSL